MAYTGARVSKMAKCRLWITTTLEYLPCLHGKEACKAGAGRLATLSDRRKAIWPPNVVAGSEKYCRGTRAQGSHTRNRSLARPELFIGESPGGNEGTFFGADASGPSVRR